MTGYPAHLTFDLPESFFTIQSLADPEVLVTSTRATIEATSTAAETLATSTTATTDVDSVTVNTDATTTGATVQGDDT